MNTYVYHQQQGFGRTARSKNYYCSVTNMHCHLITACDNYHGLIVGPKFSKWALFPFFDCVTIFSILSNLTLKLNWWELTDISTKVT